MVKTLLALDAALPRPAGAVIVAAVRESAHHRTAVLAAGPGGHVLCVDDIVARVLVQTARQPGLSLVHQELLDFAGDEFYPAAAGRLAGRPFGEALLAYTTSSVVGLLHAGGSVTLNPDPTTPIVSGDRILLVSEDDDTAVQEGAGAWVDEDAIVTARPAAPLAERLLFLGWNRRAPLVVRQLDEFVDAGTTLDVVALADPAADRAAAEATSGLTRLEVAFHQGDITDPRCSTSWTCLVRRRAGDRRAVARGGRARGAPGRRPDPGRPAAPAGDRRVLRPGPVGHDRDVRRRQPAADPRTGGRRLRRQRTADQLLMTQISENACRAAVFAELFRAEGSEIHLRPVTDYVRTDREVAFATLVESARRRRECAIGYRLHAETGTATGYGLRLNPDKRLPVRFGEHDRVIVLAED